MAEWRLLGLLQELVEVESGKGTDNRPALQQALEACRQYGAKLVIAKLDRLGRNPSFLLSLRDAGIEFVCCDMPNANRLTIGIMAMVAEQEREAISTRTRDALAAATRHAVPTGRVSRSGSAIRGLRPTPSTIARWRPGMPPRLARWFVSRPISSRR